MNILLWLLENTVNRMLKAIIDTNVILQMIYSPKPINKSASRRLFDIVASDQLKAYWCDIFSGETLRIMHTDPKLSKAKPQYIDYRLNEIINHMDNIPMDNVNKERIKFSWDPGDKYDINENDIYLAAMAFITGAKYIITNDRPFTNAFNDTYSLSETIACSPGKFLSIEKIF